MIVDVVRQFNSRLRFQIDPEKAVRTRIPRKARTAPEAEPIHLDATTTLGSAVASIVHECVLHIARSADYARKSDDPEGIHQLRVGIRRLRAALSIFRRLDPGRRRPAVASKLRALQQELGAAREWDVLIEETIGPLRHRLRDRQGLRKLINGAEAKRAEAYQRARAALRDTRYTKLVLELEGRIDGYFGLSMSRSQKARSGKITLTSPAASFALDVLRSRHAKVRRLGKKLRRLDSQELHKLRIRIKKLRYAVEFFGDLWPGRRARRYLSALKTLQQVLGTAHDTSVAIGLIAELGRTAGHDVEPAVAVVRDWAATSLERNHLAKLWRRFAKRRVFWKDES